MIILTRMEFSGYLRVCDILRTQFSGDATASIIDQFDRFSSFRRGSPRLTRVLERLEQFLRLSMDKCQKVCTFLIVIAILQCRNYLVDFHLSD